MASPQQIAANQTNAKKSTGPRTGEGKEIASRNSYRHGLTGQPCFRTPEEHAAYQAFSARMLPDLAPVNTLEQVIAEAIVSDSWRLQRAASFENGMFLTSDTGLDPAHDFHALAAWVANDKMFNLVSIYMTRIQRSLHKNIEVLRKMQKERRQAEMQPAQSAKPAATAPPATVHPIDSAAAPAPIGSVFSAPAQQPAPPPRSTENASENMAA